MVEILHGLARGAFAKIVETRNDDEAAAGAVEDEAEVGKIGVRDMLDFGKRAGFPDADHRAASVGFAIKRFDGVRRLRLGERDVDRGENAARDGKEMRRKDELRFGQAGVIENFGRMAMRKEIVGLEIFVELGEVEVDDFDASFEKFRRKFGRYIVRRCKKRGLGPSGENIFERKLTKGRATDAAELGKKFREAVSALRVPHEKSGG